MQTRYIFVILQFFAVAFVAALGVALLAPVSGIRVLGLLAMAFAAGGFALQTYELWRKDPHALSIVRYRLYAPFAWMRVAVARAASRMSHPGGHAQTHSTQ